MTLEDDELRERRRRVMWETVYAAAIFVIVALWVAFCVWNIGRQ